MTSAPKVKSHGADLAGFLQHLCLGFVSKLLAQAFLEYLSYSVNLAYSINERQKPCHLAQAFFVLFFLLEHASFLLILAYSLYLFLSIR